MKKILLSALIALLVCAVLLASCAASDGAVSDGSGESTGGSAGESTAVSAGSESAEVSASDGSGDGSDALSSDGAVQPDETDPDGGSEPGESSDETEPDESSAADTSSNSGGPQNSQDEPEQSDESESNTPASDRSEEISSADNSSVGTPSQTPSESSNPTHTHSYTKTVVDPTCMEKGYTKYACSCGDSYTGDETSKIDHKMVYDDIVEPTQTTRGERIYKCAYGCGSTETEELYSLDEWGRLISSYALQYINKYRAEEGAPQLIVSKKITEFCEYRGQQALIGRDHRGHNDMDESLAAEATKCGKFFDFTDYDEDTGEPIYPHWRADGMEAYWGGSVSRFIVVGNISAAENIGKKIADTLHASSGHWAYVGGKSTNFKDYVYVGIGFSVCPGYANCYVVVKNYNPDEKGYIRMTIDENGYHNEWVMP